MKKEKLFEGAIVLARRTKSERRSRCRVTEVQAMAYPNLAISTVRDAKGEFYVARFDIQPAKITRKSLKECGFVEYGCLGCETKCLHYKGTDVQILLENCYCQYKVGRPGVVLFSGNARQVPPPRKSQPLKYMHEVQKEIKKLGL